MGLVNIFIILIVSIGNTFIIILSTINMHSLLYQLYLNKVVK